ncbi:MAG: cinnamycin family lantibiotic [Aulosira sp. ZfuVER01]|nr:cinnamycin family lantibiotic [Aulosira sp. ZfuVER01]MDZ7997417.1 cinnamycin family lantibiotic [Aulosira sp. DedVER01a]MDZ8054554.1 cinnamycin family lantibiotic [Aulosira sp. ZfuCHP01]
MSTNTVKQSSANYLEQLLQRSAVDATFRDELAANPESFGISSDSNLVLPAAVLEQEQSCIELTDDIADRLIIAACQTSCTGGPYTIVCDGSTK